MRYSHLKKSASRSSPLFDGNIINPDSVAFSLGVKPSGQLAWQSGTAKDDDGSAKEEETTMDGEG